MLTKAGFWRVEIDPGTSAPGPGLGPIGGLRLAAGLIGFPVIGSISVSTLFPDCVGVPSTVHATRLSVPGWTFSQPRRIPAPHETGVARVEEDARADRLEIVSEQRLDVRFDRHRGGLAREADAVGVRWIDGPGECDLGEAADLDGGRDRDEPGRGRS